MTKIPRRISTAILNALTAGVVPRIGLENIAVGRELEIKAFSQDLENIAQGGASFRFVVGRYGCGKSFMLQLIRNLAIAEGFVVADGDLSPERRLIGNKNQGIATYRELMKNLATHTHPQGGAIALILEKWISSILTQVAKETGKRPGEEIFDQQVENKILTVVNDLEGLVHGFDFANVIIAYWRGYREDDSSKKESALRWLRGEFETKSEAKQSPLEVKVIIDDETWYDYLKLFAKFVSDIGYKGLIVFFDEAIHLYKISHHLSRKNNYDKLLAIFNDSIQGKAEYLGIIVGATPEFIEDKKRGLAEDEAWKSRLMPSSFLPSNIKDLSAPVIKLESLKEEELSQLLEQLIQIHKIHYQTTKTLSKEEIEQFKQIINNRLGAKQLITPREIIRDFIQCLNILAQNPDMSFQELIQQTNINFSSSQSTPEKVTPDFAEFTL
jgi:ABC-type sugar transport system ATPase subunit